MTRAWNRTILCVDDEEAILHAYKDILSCQDDVQSQAKGAKEDLDSLKEKLSSFYKEEDKAKFAGKRKKAPSYRLLFAVSGEEAVAIAKKEKESGREIAAGFFDMHLKTKMDGIDTIKAVKEIFPSLLCAVVTAYTDYSIEQIGALFKNQDEWIYFNKPFTKGELSQIACNLVSSWNIRKRSLSYLDDLSRLIMHISGIKEISLADLKNLLSDILAQVIDFVGTESGFLATLDPDKKTLHFEVGVGHFSGSNIMEDKSVKELNDKIIEAVKAGSISQVNEFVVLPVRAFQFSLAIVYVDVENFEQKDKHHLHLLKILVQNAAAAISNAKYYQNAVDVEKEKKELAISTLSKIITTLYHYLNNPLTMIRGLANVRGEEEAGKIKGNLREIRKLTDEMFAIIDVLANLQQEDIGKKIEFNVSGLEIIDIEKQLRVRKEEVEKKYASEDE